MYPKQQKVGVKTSMTMETALRNYEDSLVGKRPLVLKNPTYVDTKTKLIKGSIEELDRKKDIQNYKEADALAIVRYAVTDILGWTPEEAFHHFDQTVIDALQLDPAIKHINFPRDVNRKKDFWWIIYKAFPSQVSYNPNKRALEMYKKVLNGELKHFPKLVFDGAEGLERLHVVLHYYITNNIPANTIAELYEVFGNRTEIMNMLKEAQLYYAYKDRFRTPLDWLHDSLGEEGNNFLYRYYQYMDIYNTVETSKKKKKKK